MVEELYLPYLEILILTADEAWTGYVDFGAGTYPPQVHNGQWKILDVGPRLRITVMW